MSRLTSLRCCRVALVALLLPLPTPSDAATIPVELTGVVSSFLPLDPTVVGPLAALGVDLGEPVTAFVSWEATTLGTIDPMTGKTIYEGAIVDAEVQIGSYFVTHAPGFPIDDQNMVTVGDDREAIASAEISDTVLAQLGALDTDGILSPAPPADEGVAVAFGFQAGTSVLMDQFLPTSQETIDAFFDSGGIQAQVGSPRGILLIEFSEAVVPEPGQGLLVVIGGLVLVVSRAIQSRVVRSA